MAQVGVLEKDGKTVDRQDVCVNQTGAHRCAVQAARASQYKRKEARSRVESKRIIRMRKQMHVIAVPQKQHGNMCMVPCGGASYRL